MNNQDDGQRIFRLIKRENPYVMISKEPLHNSVLSFKAKGLLTYLLSLPEDWQVNIAHLTKVSSDGKSSVRSAIEELEKAGYIEKRQAKSENGRFQKIEYFVYENPQLKQSEAMSENQKAALNGIQPDVRFTVAGFPSRVSRRGWEGMR